MTADDAMGPMMRPRDAEPVELLVRALQPVVAEFLDQGIGVGEWIAAIKIASFQAAHAATDAESGRAIFARISVRTGMTRTELQQLRQLLRSDPAEWPKTIGRQRTARVIDGWFMDERFQDEEGLPRPLALDGEDPTLTSVIRQYAGDVPVSSVVAELKRQNLIARQPDGRYRPRRTHRDRAVHCAAQFERLMHGLYTRSRS